MHELKQVDPHDRLRMYHPVSSRGKQIYVHAKIAIVDDGIDQSNRFFDPTGFSYPAGFPKCDARDANANGTDDSDPDQPKPA